MTAALIGLLVVSLGAQLLAVWVLIRGATWPPANPAQTLRATLTAGAFLAVFFAFTLFIYDSTITNPQRSAIPWILYAGIALGFVAILYLVSEAETQVRRVAAGIAWSLIVLLPLWHVTLLHGDELAPRADYNAGFRDRLDYRLDLFRKRAEQDATRMGDTRTTYPSGWLDETPLAELFDVLPNSSSGFLQGGDPFDVQRSWQTGGEPRDQDGNATAGSDSQKGDLLGQVRRESRNRFVCFSAGKVSWHTRLTELYEKHPTQVLGVWCPGGTYAECVQGLEWRER
jgi:hypothetical protein